MDITVADPSHAADFSHLLDEYFAALDIVKRDSPEEITRSLADPTNRSWIAFADQIAVGCVALRPLALPGETAGTSYECKRLYVKPYCRGRGIAESLLKAMETHAREAGIQWIYLDSNDQLKSALRIYERLGYGACARYNDNPQATVFLRKRLA